MSEPFPFLGRCDVCKRVGQLEYVAKSKWQDIPVRKFVCRQAPLPNAMVVNGHGVQFMVFHVDDCYTKAVNKAILEPRKRGWFNPFRYLIDLELPNETTIEHTKNIAWEEQPIDSAL